MAWQNLRHSLTVEANEDLSSHQFKIVEITSGGKAQLAQPRQGLGVLQNIPQTGEAATVAVDGETKFIAGGTIAIGNHIMSTKSGGWGIAVVSADLTPATVMGIALEGVSSGGIGTMMLRPYHIPSVVSGSFITQPNN